MTLPMGPSGLLTQNVPVHEEKGLPVEVDQLLIDALPFFVCVPNDGHVGPQVHQSPHCRGLPINPECI